MNHSNGRNDETDLRKVGIDPNFWHPLARSSELRPRHMLGVTFAGDPIVLARTEAGEVFALEDRCAHRQVPLHLGVVEGERIKCGYHAWRYDRTGRVCGIPYLPKGAARPARGVRSYPCREAYGLIFVFPGDPELATRVTLPELPGIDTGEYLVMYYSRRIRCHYTFMHENLMDMNHQFLHRRVMGFVNPVLIGYRGGDTWIEARYRIERVKGARYMIGADFMIAGGKNRRPESNGSRPEDEHELMTIRTEYPYQRLTARTGGSDVPAFELLAAYVPIDREQRENLSQGVLMIRKPRTPGLIHLLRPFIRWFTNSVFREDQMIVESEQRAWDEQGGDRNREVFPLILELRNVLRRNGVPPGGALATAAHDEPGTSRSADS
jgi:phenylpropionate dioxygenase-like ring-hydroxylating dioxygenase large terminal subunit